MRQEQPHYRDAKTLVKVARRKLHNIMAPYLEDLDYREAAGWVDALPETPTLAGLKALGRQVMQTHASTRERLPLLDTFYERLFAVTGVPGSILDLACGLHPFSFPWMGLPADCAYHAYDIHAPRVELINRYFAKAGLRPLAELRDVLVEPPRVPAHLALLFKEAHRMEKRSPGCSRPFWQALPVRWLAVSLPASDLAGDHDLQPRQRDLVSSITTGLTWAVSELDIGEEMIFVIDKGETFEQP